MVYTTKKVVHVVHDRAKRTRARALLARLSIVTEVVREIKLPPDKAVQVVRLEELAATEERGERGKN